MSEISHLGDLLPHTWLISTRRVCSLSIWGGAWKLHFRHIPGCYCCWLRNCTLSLICFITLLLWNTHSSLLRQFYMMNASLGHNPIMQTEVEHCPITGATRNMGRTHQLRVCFHNLRLTLVSLTKSPSLSVFPSGDTEIRLSGIWAFPVSSYPDTALLQELLEPELMASQTHRVALHPTVPWHKLLPCVNPLRGFILPQGPYSAATWWTDSLWLLFLPSCFSCALCRLLLQHLPHYIILCNVYSPLPLWERARDIGHGFYSALTPHSRPVHSRCTVNIYGLHNWMLQWKHCRFLRL